MPITVAWKIESIVRVDSLMLMQPLSGSLTSMTLLKLC